MFFSLSLKSIQKKYKVVINILEQIFVWIYILLSLGKYLGVEITVFFFLWIVSLVGANSLCL